MLTVELNKNICYLLFINDFFVAVTELEVGLVIDDTRVGTLTYDGDNILESKDDLKIMLDCLNTWCCKKYDDHQQ